MGNVGAGEVAWVQLRGQPPFWFEVTRDDERWLIGFEVDRKGVRALDDTGHQAPIQILPKQTTIYRRATLTMWGLEVWRP